MEETKQFFEKIYAELVGNDQGKVADYIPQLSKVNPDLFGISICDLNGKMIHIGDTEQDFCLQSCSKPLNYCVARELHNSKFVHTHVGYEPSGRSFNSFTLNESGLPHNPMINAGAIMVCSLLCKDMEPAERFETIKKKYSEMAGNMGKINFDNSVFLSEKHHADRNISLAYYMRENHAFNRKLTPNEINEILDLYFQCCSITITAQIGCVMAATLANGGVCPITNDRVFSTETARDCLSLMYMCGMYDFSGQFAFEIGLPAKSGVSGCVFLVVPKKFGICIWSPRLNEQGNSVRGIEVCRKLIQASPWKLHIFHNIFNGKKNGNSLEDKDPLQLLQILISSASKCDLDTIQKLKNKIDFNECDYDKRTALHLAASEGCVPVVEYLINEGVEKDPKDRWGNTPTSEAKRHTGENYEKIITLLDTLDL